VIELHEKHKKMHKKSTTIWNLISKVFVLTTSLIFLISVGTAIYFIGFIRGFNLSEQYIESYLVSFKKSVTTTPIVTFSPTPSPNPQATKSILKNWVDWGGPELWEMVNKKRVEYGVNQLESRTELCTIASIRLNELLELGKLDNHEGFSNMPQRRPDLKWIFEKYSVIAEFLAVGGKTPGETVSLWDNTLGHKKLLSGGEYVWGCIYAQNTFSVAITAY